MMEGKNKSDGNARDSNQERANSAFSVAYFFDQ